MPVSPYDMWVPRFTLWDSTGTDLLYTFPAVQDTNLPQNPQATVVITNLRSSGAVVISGGDKPFEGFLEFWIFGNNPYYDVINGIDSLYTIITVNTPYILRVDKDPTNTYQYNVKRIVDFEWQNVKTDLRTYRQEVNLKLLCNAW